jgi:ribonuclease T2
MRRIFVRLAIAQRAVLFCTALLASYSGAGTAQNPAEPGHFDYYLLNLSWSPEFCATSASSPQCAAHPGFVLHGLWPQNHDGSWPANCGTHAPGPTNPSTWLDITPDLSLISHEWAKHGTCTTMDGDTYFTLARQAYHSITIPPRFVGVNREITMKPDEIVELFVRENPTLSAENINVTCENAHLSAIEVCLSKGLLPVSCTALKRCQASAITVTPQSSPRP